jgi:hypothetical protein
MCVVCVLTHSVGRSRLPELFPVDQRVPLLLQQRNDKVVLTQVRFYFSPYVHALADVICTVRVSVYARYAGTMCVPLGVLIRRRSVD